MKRISYLRLPALLTILAFRAGLAEAGNDFKLPDRIEVRVQGQVISGHRGNPDAPRVMGEAFAAGEISNSLAATLPREGFTYRESDDKEGGFVVTAWSTRGRGGEILRTARRQLTQIVEQSRKAEGLDAVAVTYKEKERHVYQNGQKAERTTAKLAAPIAIPVGEMVPRTDASLKESPLKSGTEGMNSLLFVLLLLLTLGWGLLRRRRVI